MDASIIRNAGFAEANREDWLALVAKALGEKSFDGVMISRSDDGLAIEALSERARDLMAERNLPPSELGRTRRLVADQRKIKIGDEAIDYLLDQLLEMLMHSNNVDEVYAEDYELRRRMREPLRRQEVEEESLQQEVRSKLKHVQEGTALWEVEYRRMMEDIKRRKGL